jgi:Na+-transporting NADH:ubiquinone oxidoreductase subunit NqrD
MNNPHLQNHLFWGSRSPLATLIGVGLLIMASSRTAFAMITLGALAWVYALTALVFRLAGPVLPEKGKNLVLVSLSAFLGGVYHLILSLINPLLAAETSLFIILTPVCCIASALLPRVETLPPKDALIRAVSEALTLGLLILAFALVREPLGFGSLSLPGGMRGTIELRGNGENSLFPIQIMGGSAGALLFFGYGIAMYRREKMRQFRRESGDKNQEEL